MVRFDVRNSEVLCAAMVRVIPHQGEVQCARCIDQRNGVRLFVRVQ